MKFQKLKFAYIIIAITIIASSILYTKRKQSFNLFQSENIISSSYTDVELGGSSKSTLENESGLQFEYVLGDSYQYAFSGISIDIYSEQEETELAEITFLDVEKFESMEFNMKIDQGKKIPIQLLTFLDGYSKKGDNNSLIFYEQFLEYDPSIEIQSIPLERFAIPNWWRASHPNINTQELALALKKVKAINIQSCIIINKNVLDKYTISGIHFISENQFYVLALALGCTLSLFSWMITHFKQKKMLVVSYNQIASKKKAPTDVQQGQVLSYINENYANPEISVLTIEKQLSIHKNKLSELIKQDSNLTFKQYLNSIRILEAKRLLLDTDLSISEIAYEVGYSNVSHFNRVFKSLQNCPPSSFKENSR
jgi:AraC-like DNA-binding protein